MIVYITSRFPDLKRRTESGEGETSGKRDAREATSGGRYWWRWLPADENRVQGQNRWEQEREREIEKGKENVCVYVWMLAANWISRKTWPPPGTPARLYGENHDTTLAHNTYYRRFVQVVALGNDVFLERRGRRRGFPTSRTPTTLRVFIFSCDATRAPRARRVEGRADPTTLCYARREQSTERCAACSRDRLALKRLPINCVVVWKCSCCAFTWFKLKVKNLKLCCVFCVIRDSRPD